jgi:hypothetical protein
MPPGSWWEKKLTEIEGCKTFHWGWALSPFFINNGINDWNISESIDKGTAIDRLNGRPFYVYRIKDMPEIKWYDPIPWLIDNPTLLDIHSLNGDAHYDWEVNFRTALWYIAKYYFGKVIPVIHNALLNCIEWVCLFAKLLGFPLIPEDQYPTQKVLENSPRLEYIGEVNFA